MPRAVILCLLAVMPACAQEDDAFINFAFASRMGSGVYDISGRTIQVYRIPIAVGLVRDTDERPLGLDLIAPITLGFYDFEPRDVLDEGVPSHSDAYSITPGVRLTWIVKPRWTLAPFAQAGPVRETATDSTSAVYTVGVRSEARLPPGKVDWEVRNELVWSGMAESGDRLADSFGEFKGGVELWHDMPAAIGGAQLRMGWFAVGYYYWTRAEFVDSESVQPKLYGLQGEIGFSFTTEPRLEIWKVKVPKIGISYRHGDSLGSFRLVIGTSF